MGDNMNVVTIIILLIGEASGVFAGFCPSWFTVSSPFFHDQDCREGNIKRIRWGEAAATVIVLATGMAVARQTKNVVPLLAAGLICAVFVGGYEYMIAHPASEEGYNSAPDIAAVPQYPESAGFGKSWG